jgi:hypothetical protein
MGATALVLFYFFDHDGHFSGQGGSTNNPTTLGEDLICLSLRLWTFPYRVFYRYSTFSTTMVILAARAAAQIIRPPWGRI